VSSPTAAAWAVTTIQWLETNHFTLVGGSWAPAPDRLRSALRRMSFEKVASELAGEDLKAYDKRIQSRVDNWDAELHRQMVEFLDEGGYEAERRIAFPEPKKPAAPKKPRVKKPVAVSVSPDQELEEAVAQELLARDARLGVW